MGQSDNLAYPTQTTLSVDDTREIISALRDKFPAIQGPRNDDICYATPHRPEQVEQVAEALMLLVGVGSRHSSS